MKINVICPRENEQCVTDANILIFLFRKIKHKIEPVFVHINSFKCEYASINIFIGAINPVLIGYAKTNMLLFSGDIFPKANTSILRHMNYIFTKTCDISQFLQNSVQADKLINIGWRSTDLRQSFDTNIDYKQALLFCHNINDSAQYQKIINAWNNSDTLATSDITLNIVNFELCKMKESDITSPNIQILKNIDQSKFESIFNQFGIHICLDKTYHYSHYLNQSMLCKSVILVPDNECRTFAKGDYTFVVSGTKSRHKKLYGSSFNFSESSFIDRINEISRLSYDTLANLGNEARTDALKNHSLNDHHFKESMTSIIKESLSKAKQTTLTNYEQEKVLNTDLPSISIVTLTHNRKKFFNLAILNYNQIDYPKDKLEWIVYDSSNEDNKVEDMLPIESKRAKYNIKYIRTEGIETIGTSRNKAIKECSNEVVMFFDDDDYYPESSVKKRICPFLIDKNLTIVGCSAIGCFEINKYLSFVDYPRYLEAQGAKKYKIATLAIKRSILGDDPCDDSSINEFNTLLSAHCRKIGTISWEGVIVSLVHSQNTTWRPVPQEVLQNQHNPNYKKECEFSFGPKMFKFLTELDISDEKLKEREEIKRKKIEELQSQEKARSQPQPENIDSSDAPLEASSEAN
jgi:glycosyltransferase involved in cell wall biosynthesis